jgi:hypothetical protein
MADITDQATELETIMRNVAIKKAREAAANIPEGCPGTCNLCDEESGRLVRGACAGCRDKYKLP